MSPHVRSFSDLELTLLQSFTGRGWRGDLWFPVVCREGVDFRFSATDSEVQQALLHLVASKRIEVCIDDPPIEPMELTPALLRALPSLAANNDIRLRTIQTARGDLDAN